MMRTPANRLADRFAKRRVKAGQMTAMFMKYVVGASLIFGQAPGMPAAIAQTQPAPVAPPVAAPPSPAMPAPTSPPAGVTPAAPSPGAPSPIVPPPSLPTLVPPAAPVEPGASQSPGSPSSPRAPETDSSNAQTIDVKPRAVLMIRGASNWDDGYKAIYDALAKLRAVATKANIKESGRPLTSFIDTDDNGFKFEAMIPIESAPEGKVDLGPDAKLGISPSGKALKFQHRGAYDDIDSTYEAITAYLDEKGLDAQNVFVEEYLNDPKSAEDTSLALDIYVFIK